MFGLALVAEPTAYVAVVAGEPDFFDVGVGLVIFEDKEGGFEFETALVDGDGVADVFCWGLGILLV